MYSVDRGLCRRDQFDGVRSGYSPERCCLNVGGMTFVGCVTAGNSTFCRIVIINGLSWGVISDV